MKYPVKKRIATFSILIFSFLSSFAYGQIAETFQLLDTNGDGTLRGSELEILKGITNDSQEEVSLKVFRKWVDNHTRSRETREKGEFARRDQNLDSKLTGIELSGYEFTDSNSDKRVDINEFMEGLKKSRKELSLLGKDAFKELCDQRFSFLDINRDSKLSGTEAIELEDADYNNDKRIQPAEYQTYLFLDCIEVTGGEEPEKDSLLTHPLVEKDRSASATERYYGLVKSFAVAVNTSNTEIFTGSFSDDLKRRIDDAIFAELLNYLHHIHGHVYLPNQSNIEIERPSETDRVQLTCQLKTRTGSLIVRLFIQSEKVVGFQWDESDENPFRKSLAESCSGDTKELLSAIVDSHLNHSKRFVRRILAGEFNTALEMLHAPIRDSAGDASFEMVFTLLKDRVGNQKSIEVLDKSMVHVSSVNATVLTIQLLVKGSQGDAVVELELLLDGLKFQISGIKITK